MSKRQCSLRPRPNTTQCTLWTTVTPLWPLTLHLTSSTWIIGWIIYINLKLLGWASAIFEMLSSLRRFIYALAISWTYPNVLSTSHFISTMSICQSLKIFARVSQLSSPPVYRIHLIEDTWWGVTVCRDVSATSGWIWNCDTFIDALSAT